MLPTPAGMTTSTSSPASVPPDLASRNAWRSDPAPASALVVSVMVVSAPAGRLVNATTASGAPTRATSPTRVPTRRRRIRTPLWEPASQPRHPTTPPNARPGPSPASLPSPAFHLPLAAATNRWRRAHSHAHDLAAIHVEDVSGDPP